MLVTVEERRAEMMVLIHKNAQKSLGRRLIALVHVRSLTHFTSTAASQILVLLQKLLATAFMQLGPRTAVNAKTDLVVSALCSSLWNPITVAVLMVAANTKSRLQTGLEQN